MKKSLLTFIFLVFSAGLFAQSPNAFNYQAALRDNQGALLNNQFVGLKIEIENSTGIVYAEEYVVQTNAFGIINVQVGVNPSSSSNTFAGIDWALGPYSLKTYVDPNGGHNYQFNSSSDILSVPYAKYAERAENAFSGDFSDLIGVPNLDTSSSNELQSISLIGDTISLSQGGGSYIISTFSGDFNDLTNVPTIDTSSSNELQVLSISNDSIFLSSGGFIKLPTDQVNDADFDPTNEIQGLSLSNDTLYLSNGGYIVLPTDQVNDADDDPTNELQVLSISNDTIYLSNGGYAALPLDQVNDDDADPTNELQIISIINDSIELSNGGKISIYDVGADYTIRSGTTGGGTGWIIRLERNGVIQPDFFRVSAGAGIALSGNNSTDYTITNLSNDLDASNEIQTLSISNDTIFLSQGGFAVVPSSKWTELNGSIYRNSKVGINTSSPFGQLEVKSLPGAGNPDIGITITRQSSNNNWGVPVRFNLQDALGQTYRYSQIVGGILNSSAKTGLLSFHVANGVQWGINYEQERMRLTPTGLGIGISSPQRDLHIAGSMRLSPLQSSPSNGSKGDVYINSSGAINYFDGNEWVNPTQQLTFNHDTLSLSNGGYVILPQVNSLNDLNDAISTSGKLGLGSNALNVSSTATDNVAIGMSSLTSVSTGESNVAVGSNSMAGNQTGSHNTVSGYYALRYNVSGSRNTGVGSRVMMHATGSDNTAMGEQALYSSSGNGNIAFGNGALYNNTTGSLNDAIGYGTLNQNTTGDGNTAIGHNALNLNTTGSRNIAIGYNANVSSNNLTNAIAIGYNAEVSISNAMVLGGIGADAVKVGIGTTSPARSLHINDVIRLEPISAPPTNPSEGDIYMDSGSHKLMVFDGTTWQACW